MSYIVIQPTSDMNKSKKIHSDACLLARNTDIGQALNSFKEKLFAITIIYIIVIFFIILLIVKKFSNWVEFFA